MVPSFLFLQIFVIKYFAWILRLSLQNINLSRAINQRTKMSIKLTFLCSGKLRKDKDFKEWLKFWYLKYGIVISVQLMIPLRLFTL